VSRDIPFDKADSFIAIGGQLPDLFCGDGLLNRSVSDLDHTRDQALLQLPRHRDAYRVGRTGHDGGAISGGFRRGDPASLTAATATILIKQAQQEESGNNRRD
jgi:hypothetical protein